MGIKATALNPAEASRCTIGRLGGLLVFLSIDIANLYPLGHGETEL
jgi:hypothetical protein